MRCNGIVFKICKWNIKKQWMGNFRIRKRGKIETISNGSERGEVESNEIEWK